MSILSSIFALELSNVDLLNIDLLDTHLDLLDTDISNKYFACLHIMSSRRLQDQQMFAGR